MDEIQKDTDRDRFMSSEEAKLYGLIDDVLTERKTTGMAKKAADDKSSADA
jgi:ATP-dependent protease ClpP protease subunit